jgi:amidohydrolase
VNAAISAALHRRELHRIPEIGLELPLTLAYLRKALTEAGLYPRDCGQGLVADIGQKGPLIALRADMDALPIAEETGLAYASGIAGAMHACGHDGHMAGLLAAAQALAADPPRDHRVRLIFQPGEEGFFGAPAMISAGCLEGVAAIAGGHVGDLSEELSPGQIGFMPGPMMAASDLFAGAFVGSGGHGSAPHQTRDPIPALAQFISGAYALRSREADQRRPFVISVCQVEAGSAFNIVPGRAAFKGTARSLGIAERELAKRGLKRLCEGSALAMGVDYEFEWTDGYPSLVNDAASVEACVDGAQRLLGPGRVKILSAPSMGGEDFAYYLQKIPGCFWFMNTQDPWRGIRYPNHHPRFDMDEALLADVAAVHIASAAALAGLVAKQAGLPPPSRTGGKI